VTEPAPGRGGATAARLAAVQTLYRVEMGGARLEHAPRGEHDAALDEQRSLAVDAIALAEIVDGVLDRQAQIDGMIQGSLDPKWRLERLEAVLRAILRAGAFELLARKQVPARVVINEYVDVAHAFFERGEPGLVNAVLDRLAKVLRADEFAAPAAPRG
jgi:N utilization substance protein B